MNDDWEDLADKPMPRFDKEQPMDPTTWYFHNLMSKTSAMPDTEMEALMQTAPGDHIPASKDQLQTVVQEVYDIVENKLTEEEQAVIEVTVIAGHSIRDAAKILGWPKTTVHRLKRSALEIVRRELGDG